MRRPTGVIIFLTVAIITVGHVNAVADVDGAVSFWREEFTMTCPSKGNWFKMNEKEGENDIQQLTLPYHDATKGLHHCSYTTGGKEVKYYFYVEGKVCKNCFELDGLAFAVVIIVDVLLTTAVMIIIYRCGRSKNTIAPQTSTTSARSGGRAQPLQTPLYEPLSPHTRSEDLYSLRTG